MPDTQQHDEFTESVEASNPLQQWREYVHVLFERRWIAITTFLVIVVSAVIWNGRQTSMYQASSTLQVDMAASNIMNIPDVSAPGGPGYMFGQYINTQVRSLRSRLFIEKVVDALRRSGSQDDRDFIRNTSDPVGTILGAISVSAIENSRLIKITIKHPSPTATALLANAVADGFIKQDLARRMEISLSAVQWLREQAEDQKGKLMTAELAIQKYREDRKMVSLEQRQDIVVSKMQSVNAALTQAENALTEAEARWQDVEALWDNGKNIRSIPAIASDPQVVAAQEQIDDSRAQVAALELRYKRKHPTLIAANEMFAEAGKAYSDACSKSRDRIERAYKLAQAKVDGLRVALKQQETQALELSRMRIEYEALKRNAETDQHLYQSILVRMKETDLAGKLEITHMRVNDRAHAPSAPFTPRRLQNVLRAGAAGLVLGLFLVVIVHLMDDRIRRVDDFEQTLGVPVLAMIPKVLEATTQKRATVAFHEKDGHATEAFRGLHASLLLNVAGRSAKLIMLVSAGAAEGKSLVSSNLSSMFAQNGSRTLLIDADLRRPSLHKLFEVGEHMGLPHLIQGQATWEDAVIEAVQPGLDLLTGRGLRGETPARLIASEEMKRILKEARERYDRVILDCPPLFGVSDPLILLPDVDGVIFVSLYNRTHRRAASEACQRLLDSETPLIGAVINGVTFTSHSYYYHRYGYNHYYGGKGAPVSQG